MNLIALVFTLHLGLVTHIHCTLIVVVHVIWQVIDDSSLISLNLMEEMWLLVMVMLLVWKRKTICAPDIPNLEEFLYVEGLKLTWLELVKYVTRSSMFIFHKIYVKCLIWMEIVWWLDWELQIIVMFLSKSFYLFFFFFCVW